MKIKWNKVTWYSKLAAVLVFAAVLFVGIYLGMQFGELAAQNKCAELRITK